MSDNLVKAVMKEDPKIEFREQEAFDKGQAARFTSVIQLAQLLDKVVFVLKQVNSDEIIAEVGSDKDLKVQQDVADIGKRWYDAFVSIRDHMEKCHAIMKAELQMSESLLSFQKQAMKTLPDKELESRCAKLLGMLDQIEAHRKSGLLEIISKL